MCHRKQSHTEIQSSDYLDLDVSSAFSSVFMGSLFNFLSCR